MKGVVMGCVKNISIHQYPEQGINLFRRVDVCFNYDTSNKIGGRIIRDDIEDPFETLIELDDGRYIKGTECQFSIL
jgi:hypothetical protein